MKHRNHILQRNAELMRILTIIQKLIAGITCQAAQDISKMRIQSTGPAQASRHQETKGLQITMMIRILIMALA